MLPPSPLRRRRLPLPIGNPLPRGGRCCLCGRHRAHGQHLYGCHSCGHSYELPPLQATVPARLWQPLLQASRGQLPLAGNLYRRLAAT
ncbi:hypothetical protein B296_00008341 [Ensete ventricosum]|uniref:Uncharacterized protein n=1 Tax=Ensete ventricosum TaxID=4639 RepID=A0A427B8Z5_ENSVE|nr:hypothetical protein B296_00008341 [Ensete ventricosum]